MIAVSSSSLIRRILHTNSESGVFVSIVLGYGGQIGGFEIFLHFERDMTKNAVDSSKI